MYEANSLSRLTNAIYASGGIKTTGSLREIQLKRNGELIGVLDFYGLLLNGDTSADLRILPGDVVFIPARKNSIGIGGEVQRPGVYELKQEENLSDLVKYAGNFKSTANPNHAEIQRVNINRNAYRLLDIDLTKEASKQTAIANGDLVLFHPIINVTKDAIMKSGHAGELGLYPWKPGMKVGDAIKSKNELLKNTDMSYLLIKRQDPVLQDFSFLQVNINKVLDNIDSEENKLLMDGDELIFFPRLLTPEDIKTKLIQDEYKYDEYDNLVIEDVHNSQQYFRKSILEEQARENSKIKENLNPSAADLSDGAQTTTKYYEYQIYDYCTVSKDLAIKIVESSGFATKKSIPLEDLETLSDPDDIQALITQIENENAKSPKSSERKERESIAGLITKTCRGQIMQPILDSLEKQIVKTNKRMSVTLFGNVHFPGIYPLTDGMTLLDAINAAGGLKESTFQSEIELSRNDISGKRMTTSNTFTVLADEIISSSKLEPMDIINVKQIAKEIKTVEITGEVYFAGTYPVSENEKLSDILKRAGGIKPQGSIEGAIFTRKELAEAEIKRIKEAKSELKRKILFSSSDSFGASQSTVGNVAGGSVGLDQIQRLVDSTGQDEEEVMGRLVIDLESMLKGDLEDILLEDGDSLHIPKQRQTISVIGEVFVANSHIFRKSLTLNDYIELSGGSTDFADNDNIYLIKSDGSILAPSEISGFFRANSNTINPGDTIVVPLNIQPFNTIKATTEVTQIIYQMALAAAAINSF